MNNINGSLKRIEAVRNSSKLLVKHKFEISILAFLDDFMILHNLAMTYICPTNYLKALLAVDVSHSM